jgi:hypothetical protein
VRRWLAFVALLAACGDGGDDRQSVTPRADLIEPAVDAVVAERGADVELLEVAANLERVDVIVRDGDTSGETAVLYRYDGEQLTGPLEPRIDEREAFSPSDVLIEPDTIFGELQEQLEDAAIIDLAVHRDGALVVNDATVASENGGVLLVLLQPDGTVVGMQEV